MKLSLITPMFAVFASCISSVGSSPAFAKQPKDIDTDIVILHTRENNVEGHSERNTSFVVPAYRRVGVLIRGNTTEGRIVCGVIPALEITEQSGHQTTMVDEETDNQCEFTIAPTGVERVMVLGFLNRNDDTHDYDIKLISFSPNQQRH
jgi:hypothetical protein